MDDPKQHERANPPEQPGADDMPEIEDAASDPQLAGVNHPYYWPFGRRQQGGVEPIFPEDDAERGASENVDRTERQIIEKE